MSLIYDTKTGFEIGDPSIIPLRDSPEIHDDDVREALSGLILSASGWRKVFALSKDESSLSRDIAPEDLVLTVFMAEAFAERLKETTLHPTVIVGIDTRPTGPVLADVLVRAFIASGVDVVYPFVVAAPEIMAYARVSSRSNGFRIDGFAYISASHNPPGHNGIKFGFTSGGVIDSSESSKLISVFRDKVLSPGAFGRARDLLLKAEPDEVLRVYKSVPEAKKEALSAYSLFAREVAFAGGADNDSSNGVGVLGEMNGSARSVSIDSDFLGSLSMPYKKINDIPGVFVHRIVPEGESLEICARSLESLALEKPEFKFGYVPDCDGDRGNIVVYDPLTKTARPLEAQTTFALVVLSELSSSKSSGKRAVVANDATSMRIERIAEVFGVDVFRSETGEANVVALAKEIRSKGYDVRVLGEGSNGGVILNPQEVRDPLSTVVSISRLVSHSSPKILSRWFESAGIDPLLIRSLGDIVSTLPAFSTTSVFEPRAALSIKKIDQRILKDRYSEIFKREYSLKSKELSDRYRIEGWDARASVGTREFACDDDFGSSGKGGLKIRFLDRNGKPVAFIWMRGSGTEPVFRIMADVENGTSSDESYFLDWHARMILESCG